MLDHKHYTVVATGSGCVLDHKHYTIVATGSGCALDHEHYTIVATGSGYGIVLVIAGCLLTYCHFPVM